MCMYFPPPPPDPTLTLEKVAAVLMEVEGSIDEMWKRTLEHYLPPSNFVCRFSSSSREEVARVWALQFLLCRITPTWKKLGGALYHHGDLKATQMAKAYVIPGQSIVILIFLL